MAELIEIQTAHSLCSLQFPKSGGFVAFVHTVWKTCLLIGEVETDGE